MNLYVYDYRKTKNNKYCLLGIRYSKFNNQYRSINWSLYLTEEEFKKLELKFPLKIHTYKNEKGQIIYEVKQR